MKGKKTINKYLIDQRLTNLRDSLKNSDSMNFRIKTL